MAKKKNVKALKNGMTSKEWKEFNKQHRLPPIPVSRMSDTKAGKIEKQLRREKSAKYNKDQD